MYIWNETECCLLLLPHLYFIFLFHDLARKHVNNISFLLSLTYLHSSHMIIILFLIVRHSWQVKQKVQPWKTLKSNHFFALVYKALALDKSFNNQSSLVERNKNNWQLFEKLMNRFIHFQSINIKNLLAPASLMSELTGFHVIYDHNGTLGVWGPCELWWECFIKW